jgi:hypothetical protein
MIFGAACLGLTLVFFMAMLAFGVPIPAENRFLVTVVFALAGAIGAAFLGGGAAVNGHIPLPWVSDHPISFAAGGGVAVLVILLLLGPYILPAPPGPTVPDVNIPAAPMLDRGGDGAVILSFRFEASQNDLDPRYQLRVQVSNQERFTSSGLILNVTHPIAARQFIGSLGNL